MAKQYSREEKSSSAEPSSPPPKKYTLSDSFKFECRKGLPCFTHCCRDITIMLTPYDVLRMKRATGKTSEEFLETYTIALVDAKGLPTVALKMKEDEVKNCPFVSEDGCIIYNDRPWSCRIYPLFPTPFMEYEFFLPEDQFCQGFKSGKEQTIEEWLASQQIAPYQSMNEAYKDVTLHEYLLHKEVKLTFEESKLFYLTCYNLDKFRRFLFDSTFFDRFDISGETIAKVASSDEHLLDFAYKWIRFSLFHDPIFRVKNTANKKI